MFDKGGGEDPNRPEHRKHTSHSHINYQEWNMKKVSLTLMLWSDFSHFLTHFSLAAVLGFFVFVHFLHLPSFHYYNIFLLWRFSVEFVLDVFGFASFMHLQHICP